MLPLDAMAYWPLARDRLWPEPHNVLFDFDGTAGGAEWIDEIAARARPLRDAETGPLVVGHGDWSVKHFRFARSRPTVVYDWDSLNTDFETLFVGNAAGTFTDTEHLEVDLVPSAEEALAFVREYEAARGAPFTDDERRAVHGAAVYIRAYAARCGHAVGNRERAASRLDEYADAFL